ncbi:MAG: dipicolinate synthase subunit B [Clostridioides sp.]|jgi:dipicolinate synthase subunit B|nr:dipicolinate synthase subunit B [Clostridioides sp.]
MLEGKVLGFGITGSFCTVKKILEPLRKLVELGATVYPVVSDIVYNSSSRFHDKDEFLQELREITGKEIIHTIDGAEIFGPIVKLDAMVIAPMTGNSMSKLASGITDTAVLMATKATLRNQNKVVIAPCTNDALGASGMNILKLINTKYIYFVPFGQDDPIKKPASMTAELSKLVETVEKALEDEQIQPILIQRK